MAREEDPGDLPKAPINARTLGEAAAMLAYLRPYRLKLVAILILLLFGSLAGLAFPWLSGEMVKAAKSQLGGKEPSAWNESINGVALVLVAVLAGQAGMSFFRAVWSVEVGEKALADLRRDAFARLIHLPLGFHHGRRVGELTSRLSADLASIRDMLVEGFPHFLRQCVMLLGGVALLLLISWRLTVAMLATVPVLMVVAVMFGSRLRAVGKEAQDKLAESGVVVEETLHNVATVKAFANEGYEQRRYGSALEEYVKAAMRGGLYTGTFFAFIVLCLFGSLVFVLWYGARLYAGGELDEGDLTKFMLFTVFVGGAAASFAELLASFQRMLGATQRVREILREPVEEEGTPTGRPIGGEVELRGVRFRYPTRPETEVLAGVSLHARAGERVALVGPSGAGKSTLIGLILRYFEPEAGDILIDGVPAREYGLAELRGRMALVPQDVSLFGGTIGENIAYGRPGASPDKIEEAARKANAHDFIMGFPDGYGTKVGERGVQLSGGQRQRIAIARAILRDPAILLLDEATSSLDAESERLVLEALDRLMEGRTSLVVAHRLSTVRRADRIYVLKDGTVAEAGTHAELMDRPEGVYRNLSMLQLEPQPIKEDAWPQTLPTSA
ncbi:MAG: ABC transporter ATP-binding protein/permease [Gemmataceae bacterium]|nr:ABC transporter ATP-binding protein/permease [Gemmataceae bacterium]